MGDEESARDILPHRSPQSRYIVGLSPDSVGSEKIITLTATEEMRTHSIQSINQKDILLDQPTQMQRLPLICTIATYDHNNK